MQTSKTLKALLSYFKEDIGSGDITTESLIEENKTARGVIIAKQSGVLAGLSEVELLLNRFSLSFSPKLEDGKEVSKGDVVAEIKGSARKILMLERVALNILMRMSGIATKTRKMKEICEEYDVEVAGTRKTTPGFRHFEKKAVELGGGLAHRRTLSEAVLIKGNHLTCVSPNHLKAVSKAIKLAKEKNRGKKIEIEAKTKSEAMTAAKSGADIVMLDNFTLKEAKNTIEALKKLGLRKKIKLEISGGINEKNIENYAKLKPDLISLGALTTNAPWLDMSLKIYSC